MPALVVAVVVAVGLVVVARRSGRRVTLCARRGRMSEALPSAAAAAYLHF
jgi:hypothetical protein